MLNRFAFREERAKALFAGMACHSIVPLELLGSAAIGLMMAMSGHVAGWPIPQGLSVLPLSWRFLQDL
jgi:phytoene dehydrogenase-like protein